MWQAWYGSRGVSSEFAASTRELVQSTTRSLIVAIGSAYLLWHIFATATWPTELGEKTWYVTIVLACAFGLSMKLLPTNLLAAQALWQGGLALAITLATLLFRQPLLALAYVMLPLVAAVTVNPRAGLLVLGLTVFLDLALLGAGILQPLGGGLALALVAGGAMAWLIGWATTRTLYTVMQWSLVAVEETRKNMEDARERRAQYARVVKDLDQAYHRLEHTNAALLTAWRRADEAERFKSDFVTTVSHELRTPLNLILGYIEVMITSPESYGAPLPGPYRRDLNAVHNSAQHLLRLVGDVLDLSRMSAGKVALTLEQVELGSLVYEAANMVRDYVTAKGLQLEIHVPDGLPHLHLDRLRMRQVLLNLLVNAARFTERGSIHIGIAGADDKVQVRVTDTGRGIPAEDLPRVFEEFRPGDNPDAHWHSGSGLGLPISKRLVELHQGRMGVESTYLAGTTFWFSLPISQPLPEKQLRPLLRARPIPESVNTEKTIVVAHEDTGVVHLLQRYLDGYHLAAAQSGAEAAALVRDLHPSALIVGSPEVIEGLDARMLAIHCPLPSTLQAAQALKASDLLVKPVSVEAVLAALDRLGRPLRRLLIADDDPEMVRLLQRIVSGRIPARDCLAASTGSEAWRLISRERPDAVLLDLGMPELSGQEILERMAQDPALAAIPVIVISGRADEYLGTRLAGSVRLEKGAGFSLGEIAKVVEASVGVLGA